MAKQIEQQIVKQHPYYVELSNLMRLAKLTTPYGLGVVELSQLDEFKRGLVAIYLST